MMRTNQRLFEQLGFVAMTLIEIAFLILIVIGQIRLNAVQLGFTALQQRILQLSIAIPYLFSWQVGFRGAANLRRCSYAVSDPTAARGFRQLAVGIAVLAFGSALMSTFGAARTFVNPQPSGGSYAAFTIFNNYLYVVIAALMFLFVYLGANKLSPTGANRAQDRDDKILAGVISAVVAVVYALLVMTNPIRQSSGDPNLPATYFLPDFLTLSTIVLPFIAAWFLGVLGSLRLAHYAPQDDAARSKRAPIRRFVKGILTTLFASILLQVLTSLGASRLFSLGLGTILAVVFGLILLQTAGYLLIWWGSRNLYRIFDQAKPAGSGGKPTGQTPQAPPVPSMGAAHL